MSQPLKLSFHHQTQCWALHSAGSGIATNLLASNPRHLKAEQTIKNATSTCSLNQVVVNLTWRQHGCLDGVFSDRMKINALHRNLWLQEFNQVRCNQLTFSICVCCNDDLTAQLHVLFQLADYLCTLRCKYIGGCKCITDINRAVTFRNVCNMTNRSTNDVITT